MSTNDLSRISDLSDISQISSSTSRLASRTNSVQSLFEYQPSITHNKSKNKTNATNYLETTVKSLAACEESIGEHAKLKLILECVKESSLNERKILSNDVADKLRRLLQFYEIQKYLYLPAVNKNSQEQLTTLGISNLSKPELQYEEKLNIKYYIETLLREKIHNFISRYEELGGTVKDVLKPSEVSARNQLMLCRKPEALQWKDKIEELSILYENELLRCGNLLNTWKELKYRDQSQLNVMNAEYLLLQAQVAELQAKMTKLTCIIRMFKETPKTIDAYKILSATVNEKLYTVMEEVRKKKELKKLYDELKGTEYDDVLKAYTHICSAIKKKKHILEML